MKITAFWDEMPRSLVNRYQRFGGAWSYKMDAAGW
jgi:hypothetical protein